MQTWIVYAVLSMIFAGLTSVLAKYGLQNISADTGLGVRTLVIFVIITTITVIGEKYKELVNINSFFLFSSYPWPASPRFGDDAPMPALSLQPISLCLCRRRQWIRS